MINTLLTCAPVIAAAGFVWQDHIRDIALTAFLSMVPMFEGRYAILTTLNMGMPALFVYLLAFGFSSLPVPFILLLLRKVLDWFYTLPIKPVRAFAAWLERRAARKHASMREDGKKGVKGRISGRLNADRAELFALFLFVAIPLPGTGVWMGSAIATLFEMPRGKSAAVILLGNATACLITTLMKVGISGFFL